MFTVRCSQSLSTLRYADRAKQIKVVVEVMLDMILAEFLTLLMDKLEMDSI